jgi:pimeloyl-ACP methyl ester carboxylesterase
MASTAGVTSTALNGTELAVREWGGGVPALLLLHGYMGSGLDWIDVAPALAGSRQVVAYDHRGHGDSGHAADPSSYTFDQLAADLAAFIAVRGMAPVDLLGHSMGGVVALMHTLRHPQTVRSLVLVDTAAAPAGNLPMDVLAPLIAMGREQGMQAVAQVVADFAVSTRAGGGADENVIRDRAVAKFSGLDVEAMAAFARELVSYPSMADQLGRIACPVAVIVGENDEGLRDAAEVMAARIPAARLVVIPGAGHSPQEDRPHEVVAAVLEHLDRVEQEDTHHGS